MNQTEPVAVLHVHRNGGSMWLELDDAGTVEIEVALEWEGPDLVAVELLGEIPEGYTFRDVEDAAFATATNAHSDALTWHLEH